MDHQSPVLALQVVEKVMEALPSHVTELKQNNKSKLSIKNRVTLKV